MEALTHPLTYMIVIMTLPAKVHNQVISIGHWYIKSVYNGFAITIDCTLTVVPFGFCSVQVMPLFRNSFWLLFRSDISFACSGLRLFCDLGILEANQYTS